MATTDDRDPGGGAADDGELDEVELAVVAYREDGAWELDDLTDEALAGVGAIAAELQEYDGVPAVALVSVGEDFALLVRRDGDRTRLVLSDLTAATEWDLARSATDLLGLEVEDDDEPAPAGDLTLLADVGLSADDLAALIDDEPHPDDLLVAIADELGFGDELEDVLDDDEEDDEPEEVDGRAGSEGDDEPDEDDDEALGSLLGDDEDDDIDLDEDDDAVAEDDADLGDDEE